jgi:hypothetical protein
MVGGTSRSAGPGTGVPITSVAHPATPAIAVSTPSSHQSEPEARTAAADITMMSSPKPRTVPARWTYGSPRANSTAMAPASPITADGASYQRHTEKRVIATAAVATAA